MSSARYCQIALHQGQLIYTPAIKVRVPSPLHPHHQVALPPFIFSQSTCYFNFHLPGYKWDWAYFHVCWSLRICLTWLPINIFYPVFHWVVGFLLETEWVLYSVFFRIYANPWSVTGWQISPRLQLIFSLFNIVSYACF